MSETGEPKIGPLASQQRAVGTDLTSFVGRQEEILRLESLLADSRLVTVTGVGGVGKTRLAREVAKHMGPLLPHGATFIELAPLRDGERIASAVIDALRIAERRSGSGLESLVNQLEHQESLLIFDNCEHLVEAAAELVEQLLLRCPKLKVLATTREALRVPGEQRFLLEPLAHPDEVDLTVEDALQYSSIQLLVERAKSYDPDFKFTAENAGGIAKICSQVDGIPLAVELAAARLRVMSPSEISSRLEQRFSFLVQAKRIGDERHSTLRAAIDWSYSLCTEDERALWSRATVFAGTFDVAAAEAVCAEGPDDGRSLDVLETITGLVDRSVLTRSVDNGQVRFRLLETIRQYGELVATDPALLATARRRHVDWCAGLVQQAAQRWFGPDQTHWSALIRLELPNIRAALTYCNDAPDQADKALQIVSPYFIWMACGSLSEGGQLLSTALNLATAPSQLRGEALWASAFIANTQGNLALAVERAQECKQLAELLNDPLVGAMSQQQLGLAAVFGGDLELARTHLEVALEQYHKSDAPPDLEVNLRFELGLAYLFAEDTDSAFEQYEHCLVRCQQKGERWSYSWALWGTGLIRLFRGEIEPAADLLHESLVIKGEFRDPLGIALVVETAAWLEGRKGDHRRAATMLGAASQQWMTFSERQLFGSKDFAYWRERCFSEAQVALGTVTFKEHFEHGSRMSLPTMIAYAVGTQPLAAHPGDPTSSNDSPEMALLTPREREICELIADGLANKDIADRLFLSPRTVESHVQHALAKLAFRSRSQIAVMVTRTRN